MTRHCPGCTGYDDGIRDPLGGACQGIDRVTYDEVLNLVRQLTLAEQMRLKADVAEMIVLGVHESEAERQFNCKHARAQESELHPGLVTWYCPECHLTQKRSHYRERGAR